MLMPVAAKSFIVAFIHVLLFRYRTRNTFIQCLAICQINHMPNVFIELYGGMANHPFWTSKCVANFNDITSERFSFRCLHCRFSSSSMLALLKCCNIKTLLLQYYSTTKCAFYNCPIAMTKQIVVWKPSALCLRLFCAFLEGYLFLSCLFVVQK